MFQTQLESVEINLNKQKYSYISVSQWFDMDQSGFNNIFQVILTLSPDSLIILFTMVHGLYFND